ncbi:hypothetical protein BKA63DRAFT_598090 [Paraphoma chrysanthemicola]|nr:hypothetical protein BKA63DRAFT_598090 [Paraphoma chrysanthemicola]
MKFTTVLVAAMATLTMATPLAPSSDVKNTVANDLVRDDCKECDDYYNKCRGSFWCWLNPVGCDISCRADTCRDNGEKCHNKCGYEC